MIFKPLKGPFKRAPGVLLKDPSCKNKMVNIRRSLPGSFKGTPGSLKRTPKRAQKRA